MNVPPTPNKHKHTTTHKQIYKTSGTYFLPPQIEHNIKKRKQYGTKQ